MSFRIPFQWDEKSRFRFLANARNDNILAYLPSVIRNSIFNSFILFFLSCFTAFSQSLTDLELKYQNINHVMEKEQAKFDSLNLVHNNMVSVIDKEKQKEKPDKIKITNLLASTIVTSNQVKEQQIKLDKIEIELESVKKNLDTKYAAIIDSLKNLEKLKDSSVDKELLKSQKLEYIERRLKVAPRIYSLSFNPHKLIQYKSSSKSDTLEQKIYEEYLSNALSEVDTQMVQLALLKNEIEEIVLLQNEAFEFIEDIDSDIPFNPAIQSSEKSARDENVFLGGEPNILDNRTSDIYFQANSYLHILNQLKTSTDIDVQSPWQTPTDTIPANLTFQQYLNLLVEVDKMLQDYRIILEHKLETN